MIHCGAPYIPEVEVYDESRLAFSGAWCAVHDWGVWSVRMTADARPMIVRERVRWADVDLIQIMRFSAYTRLIENAEQELMRAAGFSYATLFDAPKFSMPRRHLAIEYFAPARMDDELALLTYISRMGDTSATINVDVMSVDGVKTFAQATMVVVCVTPDDFQKCRMPDDLREGTARFVTSAENARAWFAAECDAAVVSRVDSSHERREIT